MKTAWILVLIVGGITFLGGLFLILFSLNIILPELMQDQRLREATGILGGVLILFSVGGILFISKLYFRFKKEFGNRDK